MNVYVELGEWNASPQITAMMQNSKRPKINTAYKQNARPAKARLSRCSGKLQIAR